MADKGGKPPLPLCLTVSASRGKRTFALDPLIGLGWRADILKGRASGLCARLHHVDRNSAVKLFLPLHSVTDRLVEADVLDEKLIGVEARARQVQRRS